MSVIQISIQNNFNQLLGVENLDIYSDHVLILCKEHCQLYPVHDDFLSAERYTVLNSIGTIYLDKQADDYYWADQQVITLLED